MDQLSLSAEEDDAFTLEGSLCSQTVSYELWMVGKLLSPRCFFLQRMSCRYVEARKRYFCSGTR